jgi:hypothetical protein
VADLDPSETSPETDVPDSGRPASRERHPARHDTDVTSLVFGLLFLGLVGVWALVESTVVSWPDASRIFPVVLVAVGLVGLVSSLGRSRRSRRRDPGTAG